MTNTKEGAAKARKTILERYGKDFYRNVGRCNKGTKRPSGFAVNPALAAIAGRKGGRLSTRGKSYWSGNSSFVPEDSWEHFKLLCEFIEEVFNEAGLTDRNRTSGSHITYNNVNLEEPDSYKSYIRGLIDFTREDDKIDATNIILGAIYLVRKEKRPSADYKNWLNATNAFNYVLGQKFKSNEYKWQYGSYCHLLDPFWGTSKASLYD